MTSGTGTVSRQLASPFRNNRRRPDTRSNPYTRGGRHPGTRVRARGSGAPRGITRESARERGLGGSTSVVCTFDEQATADHDLVILSFPVDPLNPSLRRPPESSPESSCPFAQFLCPFHRKFSPVQSSLGWRLSRPCNRKPSRRHEHRPRRSVTPALLCKFET